MTFREILDAGLSYGGEETGSDYEALLKKVVNQYYREALSIANSDLEEGTVSLTTVSGTADYGLPLYNKRAINFDDDTNNRTLSWLTKAAYRKTYPGSDASGTPHTAIPLGVRGVQRQPAASGVLTIQSSIGSDADPRFAVLSGLSGGNALKETITLNGVNPVSSSNSYDASSGVQRLVLGTESSQSITGVVTLKDSSGNVLADVAPYYESSPSYQWFKFYPTPDGAITYTVDCELRKPPLISDDDWPELNEDFHDLLVEGPAGVLLPTFGRTSAGDRHRTRYRERLDLFRQVEGSSIRRSRKFADVMRLTGSIRPGGPRIEGINA
tara:strand:- start:3412 stop:4389 length:978 start_codon:yes stop_codon:yes gene_type:complete